MIEWLTTTDHKKIGIMYIVATMVFFVVAGVLAMLIRAQLAVPENSLLGPHVYNQVFTLHGTAMIFFVIAPFGIGLANYLVPLQIGAPDVAFPRLNATGLWLFVLGGITVFAGLATYGGAAATGWTAYAPLSGIFEGSGAGQDLWFVGLLMASISTIITAINLLVTIFLLRAPGMTMWRIPIFTWEIVATGLLILMAFPSLAAVFAMSLIERHMGGRFFDPAYGGNPILYQHLFWFFGHPEVYVMILPYFGIVTEIVATFSRKPVFGYVGMVIAAFAIAGLSLGVWAHHMFTTGAVSNLFFSGMSFLIAVPTGVKFVNWIGTMWKGSIEFAVPMLFAIGFMLNFLIGGITGVMVASPPYRLSGPRQLLPRATLPLHHRRWQHVCALRCALLLVSENVWSKARRADWTMGFCTALRRFQRHLHSDGIHGHGGNGAARLHVSADRAPRRRSTQLRRLGRCSWRWGSCYFSSTCWFPFGNARRSRLIRGADTPWNG